MRPMMGRWQEHKPRPAVFVTATVLVLGFLMVWLSAMLNAPWMGLFVTS
jgi:hypothetical protein